ncbi:MAG: EAL domain-containing protein [Methylotenera sp.]|nr:EAL domain-containing protein [Methylotenera sp.]
MLKRLFIPLLLLIIVSNLAFGKTVKNQVNVQTRNPTLIVGSEQDFPPFSTGMTDETAGGFTVEMWKAVAVEAGLKNYHIRVLPFTELLNEFKAGKIDVLINLNITDEAHAYADFSVPHTVFKGGIFVRKNESNINSESDLNGKSIIMMKDDVETSYATLRGWGKQLVLVQTAEEGMRLLASGKHDAFLINKIAGLQIIAKNKLTNIKALKANANFTQKFAFAVQEGQTDLLAQINEAFAITNANKTYSNIYEKWFGVYETKEIGLFDSLKYIIPIASIFICILGYSFYRRKSERKLANKIIQNTEAKISTLVNAIPDLIWLKDVDGVYLSCNSAFEKYFDAKEVDIVGKTDYDFLNKELADLFRENDKQAMLLRKSISNDEWLTFANGGYRGLFEAIKTPILDKDNNLIGVLGISRDITERWQAENLQRIAATAFESQEGMMVTDSNNVILRVNEAFTKITGYSAEETIGQTPSFLKSGRHDNEFYAEMWKSIRETGAWEGEIWNKRKNGEIHPEHLSITAVTEGAGIVKNYVASRVDITLRKQAESKINHLAFYDTLTQLPNRRLLLDRLHQALSVSALSGRRGALLFIDLDHFKTINETQGHDVGDLLLQQVATRLSSCIRIGDSVARFGSDDFVVLLEVLSENAVEAASQTQDVANKILYTLSQPYHLNGHSYDSTASIGGTLFNGNDVEVDELLKQADIAIYQSKSEGRNTFKFIDPKIQEAIVNRADLERELRKAIQHNQFQLYYQVQVSSSGEALGAEVLIRWNHPERGMISPFNFIPIAEETGLILPIGQWVLETACARLKTWQQNPLTQDLSIAVNVSARQFHQVDFVAQVLSTIARHDIDPSHLKLELTESMLVYSLDDIIIKMQALSKMGILFSLDDFGTGYSSLQYLKRLPLDQLKIDQSFVRDVVTDANDRSIVRTIVTMAHSLDINVIAEGVETNEQRQYLLDIGCKHYQGYLFGKPMLINEFEALLSNIQCADA